MSSVAVVRPAIAPPVVDALAVADAQQLLHRARGAAMAEAAARADARLEGDDIAGYAHWRRVERLLPWLATPIAIGTVH